MLVAASTALGASRVLDPAEVRQFFRIIDGQANHMDALISDLLDAGRIDAGTLSVSPEPTEVAALVDEARNTFLSGGARQAVRIDLPPDLPRVHADRQRIVQVLNNLLSNASRHSPESSTIGIGAVRDGVLVAVSVSDEGRGVPPELLPHLFTKYSREAGAESARGLRGSGLGLAICKGLGTRFTFTLPVAGEAACGAPHGSSRPSPEGHEPTRILVVDDDPQTLRFVRDALLTAGYAPLMTGESLAPRSGSLDGLGRKVKVSF